MTWRIATRHTSTYRYSSPVVASYNEARMTPRSSSEQIVLESRLSVVPSVPLSRYVDYWSTVVHAFDVHQPHEELTVVSSSLVETASARPLEPGSTTWEDLRRDELRDRFAEQLTATTYAPFDEELAAIAHELQRGLAPCDVPEAVGEWLRSAIRYEPGTTGVSTAAVEAWRQGSGVCQDFAHLGLVLLRQLGIPARYTSGYLHPLPDAHDETVRGASHAWIEAWIGRWSPFDPTNGEPVGDRHVVVAHGRDYADVAPLLGVYRGGGLDRLEVSVELTRRA